MQRRILSGFLFVIAAAGACKDGAAPDDKPGPPTAIAVSRGGSQSAPANTQLPINIEVVVRDAKGRGVADQAVNFSVLAGGGSLVGINTATTDANGVATAPAWRLGKSATNQILRVSASGILLDVTASVLTSYDIEVRFWGDPMSPQQQLLFTNAADRISGIITGDIIGANAQNVNLETACGVKNQPPLNEIIDDVVIYASIDSIDGPGKVLARAGWCLGRNTTVGFMPAVGIMLFDERDLNTLTGAGSLQDVITHEMLHVVGIGTLWEDRGLLTGSGTPDPRFTGAQGRNGCVGTGGTIACASSVPVEGTGGPGTADGHWRETTFDTELMTGFIDSGVLPISATTVNSLADLGYVINSANNDSYMVAINALRAESLFPNPLRYEGWEQPLNLPKYELLPDGTMRRWKGVQPR